MSGAGLNAQTSQLRAATARVLPWCSGCCRVAGYGRSQAAAETKSVRVERSSEGERGGDSNGVRTECASLLCPCSRRQVRNSVGAATDIRIG